MSDPKHPSPAPKGQPEEKAEAPAYVPLLHGETAALCGPLHRHPSLPPLFC